MSTKHILEEGTEAKEAVVEIPEAVKAFVAIDARPVDSNMPGLNQPPAPPQHSGGRMLQCFQVHENLRAGASFVLP